MKKKKETAGTSLAIALLAVLWSEIVTKEWPFGWSALKNLKNNVILWFADNQNQVADASVTDNTYRKTEWH